MAFDRRETSILLLGDFLVLVVSLWVALLLRNLALPPLGYFEANLVPFLPMFGIALAVFYIAGLYEKQTRPIRRVMGTRILGAQAATVALGAILFFTLPFGVTPKTILALFLAVSVVGESLWRFYRMRREMREENRVPAVLLGSGSAVLELYEEISNNDRYLIRFIARLDTKNLPEGDIVAAVTRLVNEGARIVIVDTFDPAAAHYLARLSELATSGVVVRDFASLYEEIFDRIPLDHFDTAQLLETLSRPHAVYDAGKRAFDMLLSLVAGLIAAPFIALAALVLAPSGAPFITHERVGKNGKSFKILKLRSMLLDDHGDPELQKKNRVTGFGRFLRKTRIDELPQLWNIIKGDLSFIGPRPELPPIAAVYEKEIPQYWMRHLIAPGLSGWAQIHDYDAPRGGADVPRTRRKLSLDLYYLKHRSLGLDLAIALKTIRALVALSGT